MGTSMTLGEVVALRKLLDGLVSDRMSSAELFRLGKDAYVLRVLRRLRMMEERGRALSRGEKPPPPLKVTSVMASYEPALLPPEASDAQ